MRAYTRVHTHEYTTPHLYHWQLYELDLALKMKNHHQVRIINALWQTFQL